MVKLPSRKRLISGRPCRQHTRNITGTRGGANTESDARTSAEIDAETGVELSEPGGLEIVEGADDIVLGV